MMLVHVLLTAQAVAIILLAWSHMTLQRRFERFEREVRAKLPVEMRGLRP